MTDTAQAPSQSTTTEVDVVVVGAGFAGMYLLHRLRGLGMSAVVIEAADDVGGTWYWNRYPGARCDIQSLDYSYSWDPELEQEWRWTEKYATQPEILRYAQHVADKHDLRRDIRFATRVGAAVWDETAARWHVSTDRGEHYVCRSYVMASGCLSMPKQVDIEGADRFAGDVYFTSSWPHDGVDLTGKRVAVIGTGSSSIQSVPVMARQASSLTVFQRTPNFSIPAHNGPIPADKQAAIDAGRDEYRAAARLSPGGVPRELATVGALQVSEDERNAGFEAGWQAGGIFEIFGAFNDTGANEKANDFLAEFIRNKIRSIVHDPATAEDLCPTDHPAGTKRPCVDTGYYETFNLPHVRLVNLRKHPIATITETGVDLVDESLEFDVIVFATGFDAMTGAIVAVDITGRDGRTLRDEWAAGPVNYLGLMVEGFPNLFMITGPGSPSVLSNMMVSIEQHVDWIADCVAHLRAEGLDSIEATPTAQSSWVQHVNDFANISLLPKANSWYMGANVPGKPRVCLPYVGGVGNYRLICDEVVSKGYLGFQLSGPTGTQCNDGVVRRLQPDVGIMLDMMATMGLPSMDSMSAPDARAFSDAMSGARPPGPDVAEIVDGTFPGAAGELRYRLYRPAGDGPHPVVLYFHGGGWVLGSADSDDPFCRDMCVRTGAIIVSADYRHAPEERFPAAVDDAIAALQWIAGAAESLGGDPSRLAVAGWSAGGNLAAVVCQHVRDHGGPSIAAQLLLTPVTDSDLDSGSYRENGEGYILTRALMEWFWNHYTDPEQRSDVRVAPLRAASLAGLPPAIIVTAEFDPLRDEGNAYAAALSAAGIDVTHLQARGHTHTSIPAVDAMLSGAPVRAQMAEALTRVLGARALAG
jgi:cation diffusion facilitator CzcD-associated flavoprotein CzcO/acetyl esterase/lipase